MKKKIFGFAAAVLLTVGLAACGNNSDSKGASSKSDDTTLKVGASPTPHADIKDIRPFLKYFNDLVATEVYNDVLFDKIMRV